MEFDKFGGGMYNYNSSPSLTNCSFLDQFCYRRGPV